jgi:hypothetical protein
MIAQKQAPAIRIRRGLLSLKNKPKDNTIDKARYVRMLGFRALLRLVLL